MTETSRSASQLKTSIGERSAFDRLLYQLRVIRNEMLELERAVLSKEGAVHHHHGDSARNLLHYLALRRHDIREIQETLASYGLSSLGRSESHVKANVEAIQQILHRLSQNGPAAVGTNGLSYSAGLRSLEANTERLIGPKPARRTVRIMVTMPTEAATNYEFVRNLVTNGMDCMRINCAYDDVEAWAKMINHARRADKETGHSCRVLMDLGGPKLRTAGIRSLRGFIKWRPQRNLDGTIRAPARIWLTEARGPLAAPAPCDAKLPVTGTILRSLQPGDTLKFFDARGSSRSIVMVESTGGGWWAESSQ